MLNLYNAILTNPIAKTLLVSIVGILAASVDTIAQQAMTGAINGTEVGAIGAAIGYFVHNALSAEVHRLSVPPHTSAPASLPVGKETLL